MEPGEKQRDRSIRVFISSTFRDMMNERDLLVKQVFPTLRRKCAQRFVTFTEVDLRWGITEEQAAEGKVLPLCLAEIERSRPYFLGLLGERYGWIPDEIPATVVENEPWLKEHLHGRKSVTELEILHGVLNDPAMKGLAFFYFRDPAYVKDASLSADERKDMVGLTAQGKTNPTKGLCQTTGLSGMCLGQRGHGLGKSPARTGGRITEEPPNLQVQPNRGSHPRQVGKDPGVTAVNPAR